VGAVLIRIRCYQVFAFVKKDAEWSRGGADWRECGEVEIAQSFAVFESKESEPTGLLKGISQPRD
jgi:hypothetical protein